MNPHNILSRQRKQIKINSDIFIEMKRRKSTTINGKVFVVSIIIHEEFQRVSIENNVKNEKD